MSTRSTISIENQDGTFDSIYCHFDGYLSNNGKLLIENYTTEEDVKKLLSHGDMSSLGKTPEESTFYHRDRGEDFNMAEGVSNIFRKELTEDYNYLFTGGEWFYFEYGQKELKKVEIKG